MCLGSPRKPSYPSEVIVPTAEVERFDLTENYGTYTVKSGENLSVIISKLRPHNAENLTDEQILAAVVRANPKTYNNNGFFADKVLNIPSIERIALEETKTGNDIKARANSNSLLGYKLPSLTYPWSAEDEAIRKAIIAQKDREQQVKDLDIAYQKCVDKVVAEKEAKKKLEEQKRLDAETPLDIGDDSLMIQDEPEENTNNTMITYNESGKRVITLKANNNTKSSGNENGRIVIGNSNNGSVKGTTLVLGKNGAQGFNSKGELQNIRNSNSNVNTTTTSNEVGELKAEIQKLHEQLKQKEQKENSTQSELQEIKNLLVQMQQQSNEKSKSQKAEETDTSVVAIGVSIISLIVLFALGLLIFMRLQRTKMRQALNDDAENIDDDDVEKGLVSEVTSVIENNENNSSK